MLAAKVFIASFAMLTMNVYAKKNEIREIFTNDKEMKTINLSLGRSTILSFTDKPVKVVAGNSNYINIEYVGTDLTLQPLAKVDTNLFVYTQNKTKYGFHLKVGGLEKYDDMVYVKFKGQEILKPQGDLSPQVPLESFTLKIGKVEIVAKNLIRLRGTKTYALDFEVKNKNSKSLKLKSMQVFVSKNQQRLKGQQVVFDKDSVLMFDSARGRLFFTSEKVSGIKFYATLGKTIKEKNLLKKYL